MTFAAIVQAVIQEFVQAEQSKVEPATRRNWWRSGKRRESLEQRVNELVAENEQARATGGGSGAERGDSGGVAEAGRGQGRSGVSRR